MKSRVVNSLAVVSLLLAVSVGVLWVRGRSGEDRAAWQYSRYLANGNAADTHVSVSSDRRLWLNVGWGHVGPYDGQLVWGYHVNADQSSGRPRLDVSRTLYADMCVPLEWTAAGNGASIGSWPFESNYSTRSKDVEGDDSVHLSIGVSHWFAVILLLIPLIWCVHRRARRLLETSPQMARQGAMPLNVLRRFRAGFSNS